MKMICLVCDGSGRQFETVENDTPCKKCNGKTEIESAYVIETSEWGYSVVDERGAEMGLFETLAEAYDHITKLNALQSLPGKNLRKKSNGG